MEQDVKSVPLIEITYQMKRHQVSAAFTVAEAGSIRGAVLFERRSHCMTPPPLGELVLLRARIITNEARYVLEEVQQYLLGDKGASPVRARPAFLPEMTFCRAGS